jgi:ribonuclease HI
MRDPTQVIIYTDGACFGNPGPGGFAAILDCAGRRREISGGRRRTTNNRMELLAAVAALETLQWPCRVTLYSDAQYLVEAMTKGWPARWQADGWRRGNGEAAVNPDLWEALLELCAYHEVTFVWVRGHAGDPANERCDALAVAAARGTDLPEDEGYEARLARAAAQPSLFD